MSAATATNTASKAGRKSALKAQAFRKAPELKVSAAAGTRVKPGQWDPVPGLAGVDKASREATSAHAIFSCLASLGTLMRKDPSRAAWPDANAAVAKWNRIKARLLKALVKAPDLEVADLHRMVRIVSSDNHMRGDGTGHALRLTALLRRVEEELIERARLPTAGADADLIATCERYINRSRRMNAKDHPEASKNFDEMSEYPALRKDEQAILRSEPQTMMGLAAVARVALYGAEIARCHLSPPAWSENDELILAGKILRKLAGDAGFGALGASLPVVSFCPADGVDDHYLIERCDDFVRRKREAWALEEPYFGTREVMPSETRARVDALSADYHDRLNEILGYSAGTPQGLRAKARAMEAHLLRNEDGSWLLDHQTTGTLIDNILTLVPDTPPTEHCMLTDFVRGIDTGWDKNTGPLDTDESAAVDITPHSFQGMLLQVGILLAEVHELHERATKDECTDAALNRARRLAWSLQDGLRVRGAQLPSRVQEYYFPPHLDPFAGTRGSHAQARAEADLLEACRRYMDSESPSDLMTIAYTKAHTPEEREAKALAAMTLVQTNSEGGPIDHDHAMLWSLAEDMAGRDLEAPQ
ncbi:hypothetical protein [Roseomonas xinghualingensis]|uniref:hypothetical protein n=1 Tax=Roseomonas xinghualingensis TaxID=2986475 RepID=UPI0021F23746|nr:hypothetical protein [Roseomonas sp. SXEYE001]MCV4209354.1 hypothetical protein [Roseomonas sp. SXEYE001]